METKIPVNFIIGQKVLDGYFQETIIIKDVEIKITKDNLPYSELYNANRKGSILKFGTDNKTNYFNTYEDYLKSISGIPIEYPKQEIEFEHKYNIGDTVYYFGRGERLRESTIESITFNTRYDSVKYLLKSKNKESEKQYFPCVNRLEVKDYEIHNICEEHIYSTREEFIEYKMNNK